MGKRDVDTETGVIYEKFGMKSIGCVNDEIEPGEDGIYIPFVKKGVVPNNRYIRVEFRDCLGG